MPKDPQRALNLTADANLPVISEFAARRLVDADLLEPLVAELGKKRPARKSFLEGMRAGLEGRSDLKVPAGWSGVYAKLKRDGALRESALAIAQLFGDGEAANTYLAILRNEQAPLEQRREAIKGLADKQWEELTTELPALLEKEALRTEAIRAVAAYERWELGRLLLEKYQAYGQAEKAEVIQTLASRQVYGSLLTDALKKEQIPRSDVPAYVARQLRRVVGNGFVEIWGPIDELSGNKEEAFSKYRDLLSTKAIAKADLAHGRELFDRTCGACHKMYGEGRRHRPGHHRFQP